MWCMSFQQPAPSMRLFAAIDVAARCHAGQMRKGTDLPYISHIMGVFACVTALCDEEDVHIAALLHDVIEDQSARYSFEQMEAEFGAQVVGIVKAVTKDASIRGWWKRNKAYLAELEQAPKQAVLVALADKTHNLSTILRDFDQVGDELWQRFANGAQGVRWWYLNNLKVFARRVPEELERSGFVALCDRLEKLTAGETA